MFTEEQELEMWILLMWDVAWGLSDDILIWLADSYPKYFEIKDNKFYLKRFESSLNFYSPVA